jgi:hypothetical protein
MATTKSAPIDVPLKHEYLPCQSVFGCDHEAAWSVDLHGCAHQAVCTEHLMRWIRQVKEPDACDVMHCPMCFRHDFTLETVATIVPL